MEILSYWPWLVTIASVALQVITSTHVLLSKRDAHAAIGWMAVVWLTPFVGAILYYLFGINRIQRRARRLRRKPRKPAPPAGPGGDLPGSPVPPLPPEAAHLMTLVHLGDRVTETFPSPGNAITPLVNGDEAYPAMLQAIDEAKRSVGLCMYIFNNDDAGRLFVEALARAQNRGVAVRVLLDDVGAHFGWGTIVGPLTQAGVPTARFIPKWIPRFFAYANLRNHRKILIVDGRVGFTGGMNISDEHWLAHKPSHPIHDLQFRIEGPVVAAIQEVFAQDWRFAAEETLTGDAWFPDLEPAGPILARGVRSGPDEDLEKIRLILLGALAAAERSVRIVTPYFLPDPVLISALNIATLRGVRVDILIPKIPDLLLVQWACMAQLAQVLEYGCRVWLTSPPFPHTKLMIVDGVWTFLGSCNWDPRSLRLNFEFNIECYDRDLAERLNHDLDREVAHAERMTLTKLNQRPFLAKLRDGVARLLSPHL